MALDLNEAPVYTEDLAHGVMAVPSLNKFTVHEDTSNIVKGMLEKEYFGNFKDGVNQILGEVKTKYSENDETASNIDLLFDTVFAPLRLEDYDVQELRDSGDKKDFDRYKTVSARLQHSFAHGLFYALSGNASSAFRTNMQQVVTMYENLSKISPTKVGSWYKGVCGHAGGYFALDAWGCKQYPPSYLMDPLAYSDNPNELYMPLVQSEVYDADIKHYFDDAAVKDGHLFLVDFKGVESGNGRLYEYMPAQPYSIAKKQLPHYLAESFTSQDEPRVVQKVTLVVPKRYTNMPEMFASSGAEDIMVPEFYHALDGLIENAKK